MENKPIKQIVRDLYKKDMSGYSSDSTNNYLKNKGLENGIEYKIDDKHSFIPFARKGNVCVNVFYRGRCIDTKSYLKRNKLI